MSGKTKGGISLFWLGSVFILAAIFAAYSAYWFIMRAELEKGVLAWIEDERARGAVIEYEALELKGYPYRFALHVDRPVYGDGRAAQWSGEELQLVMQPWNWRHIIARSPGGNRVEVAGQAFRANLGDKSAASLSWTDEGLRRFSLSLDEVRYDDGVNPASSASGLELHLRPAVDDPASLQIVFQWRALSVPGIPSELEFLGRDLQPSRLLVEVREAYPVFVQGGGLQDWVNRNGSVEVAQLLLNWGALKFGLKADLELDDRGRPEGAVDIRLDDSEALAEALRQSDLAGQLSSSELEQALNGIALLGQVSRDGGFLPLSLIEGRVRYLGQDVPGLDLPAFALN